MPDGHLNAEGMNSLNHYSYGSIEAWMYGEVCGIRPKEAGFKKAVIAPHADRRLGKAECKLDTAAGCYKSSWHYEDDTVVYEVEVHLMHRQSLAWKEWSRRRCKPEVMFFK